MKGAATIVRQDELHQVVDTLTDEEARLWLEALGAGDPMLLGMALAAIDDEPGSEAEDVGADEAWQEHLEGKALTAEAAKRRYLS